MAGLFAYALFSVIALPKLVAAGIYYNLEDVQNKTYDFIVVGGVCITFLCNSSSRYS
jgi:hypothetical protein